MMGELEINVLTTIPARGNTRNLLRITLSSHLVFHGMKVIGNGR
jgi:hypothetical protein